jgi:hypothetical protein
MMTMMTNQPRSGGLRGPVGFTILGLVAGLSGWFLLGSSIGLGVVHGQRCGDHPELSDDSACRGTIPWAGRAKLGAGLLLLGAGAVGSAAVLGLVRAWPARGQDPPPPV